MQWSGKKSARKGAALIEFAVVAVIFFMMLYGIMEYATIIYFRNVVTNAAREGARYGVVNVDDTTIVTDTQAKVKSLMFNIDKQLTGYTCDVYRSDSAGTNIGTADSAAFGNYLAVHVYGTYKVKAPVLLFLSTTLKIQSKSLMCSEAN